MVQDATPDGIPANGAYVVRAPQAADALSVPLRKAFGKDASLPGDIEACMTQLRRIKSR